MTDTPGEPAARPGEQPGEQAAEKNRWRAELTAARAAAGAAVRATEAEQLTEHLRTAVLPGLRPGDTLAAYIPVGDEPGSTAMLDAAARAGLRVIVPVTGPPGPLSWAEYRGTSDLVAGRFGLREPAGPRLGSAALGAAAVVLVPALAADRSGTRLGRGAGYYDRSLDRAAPGARLIVVVRDGELVDHLPADPHDVPMGWALTPAAGLVRLGS